MKKLLTTASIILMFATSVFSQEIYSTRNKENNFEKVKTLIVYIGGDVDKFDKNDIKRKLIRYLPTDIKILEFIYENPSMIDNEKTTIMKSCLQHQTPYCLRVAKKKDDINYNPLLGYHYDYTIESILIYGVTDIVLWKCAGKTGGYDWVKKTVNLGIQDNIF